MLRTRARGISAGRPSRPLRHLILGTTASKPPSAASPERNAARAETANCTALGMRDGTIGPPDTARSRRHPVQAASRSLSQTRRRPDTIYGPRASSDHHSASLTTTSTHQSTQSTRHSSLARVARMLCAEQSRPRARERLDVPARHKHRPPRPTAPSRRAARHHRLDVVPPPQHSSRPVVRARRILRTVTAAHRPRIPDTRADDGSADGVPGNLRVPGRAVLSCCYPLESLARRFPSCVALRPSYSMIYLPLYHCLACSLRSLPVPVLYFHPPLALLKLSCILGYTHRTTCPLLIVCRLRCALC
ncbi:hypothetical protein CERSUDRAFT_120284, partial [Gelatoporia subvermispora B]